MRVLAIMALLLGGTALPQGVAAYAEGRFQDALDVFSAAEREAGNRTSPELLHNMALAALRAGRLRTAEISAEKAAVRGGARFVPLRDFILGNVAFARCEQAEILAGRPESGPPALELAILQASIAAKFWQRAAVSRPDWPPARRNVQRALLKSRALQEKRRQAEKNRKQAKKPPVPRDRDEKNDTRQDKPRRPRQARLMPQLLELSPEQVKHLLEKLEQKEREKTSLRKARQKARRAGVEKDW